MMINMYNYLFVCGRESKAMINNEFLQNSAVTCLCWSIKGPIVFGLENGRVRAARIDSTEMAWTLYSTDSSTIALTVKYI